MEFFAHRFDGFEEVGASSVHFVDECDSRDAVAVCLSPNGFRLGLNASNCAEYGDSAIENSQGSFHFNREVDVARGVDDVDLGVFPIDGGRSRGDRDATFPLLLHEVHGRGAFVHFADAVNSPRVKKNPFGRGRFARVNVGHDPNIADIL